MIPWSSLSFISCGLVALAVYTFYYSTAWQPNVLRRYLYVEDFLYRLGLSYLHCRRFYEGSESGSLSTSLKSGLRVTKQLRAIT